MTPDPKPPFLASCVEDLSDADRACIEPAWDDPNAPAHCYVTYVDGQEQMTPEEADALAALLLEGLNSGPPEVVDLETMLAEMKSLNRKQER